MAEDFGGRMSLTGVRQPLRLAAASFDMPETLSSNWLRALDPDSLSADSQAHGATRVASNVIRQIERAENRVVAVPSGRHACGACTSPLASVKRGNRWIIATSG